MPEEIAVVKPYYAIETAYNQGYDRFNGTDHAEADPESITHFKETATWANSVAPHLRAAAGYADAGHGTYQESRQVAAVKPGCEEDDPAAAELVGCHDVYSTLVDAFDAGAVDAMAGDDRDPGAVSW
jgi:hypothetical protein